MNHLPPLPAGVRILRDEEFHRVLDEDSSLPDGPHDCPTCGGSGTFRYWGRVEPDVVQAYECPCAEQWMARVYLRHCGLGIMQQRWAWHDLGIRDQDPQMAGRLMDMVRPWIRGDLSNLVLSGERGVGKTLVAVLMMKDSLSKRRGSDPYFVRFPEAVEMFRSGWRDPEQRRLFHVRINNASVLVLDDIGAESRGHESWVPMQVIEEVLRHRIAGEMPTILTTNLSEHALASKYSIGALVAGYGRYVRFTNQPYWDLRTSREARESSLGITRPIVFA